MVLPWLLLLWCGGDEAGMRVVWGRDSLCNHSFTVGVRVEHIGVLVLPQASGIPHPRVHPWAASAGHHVPGEGNRYLQVKICARKVKYETV